MNQNKLELRMRLEMKVIGVTGGIGSGKSTVTNILGEFGAKVINADNISRDIIYKGSKAYCEIVAYFGEIVLNEEGELDRKKLGEIVFSDSEKLEKLTDITHKYIIMEIIERIEHERACSNINFIVLEVAIPVEHGFKDLVDEVWVVISELEERIKRVMIRNGYTYDQVIKRINSQMSEDEYIKISDKVIKNSGSIHELKETLRNLVTLF